MGGSDQDHCSVPAVAHIDGPNFDLNDYNVYITEIEPHGCEQLETHSPDISAVALPTANFTFVHSHLSNLGGRVTCNYPGCDEVFERQHQLRYVSSIIAIFFIVAFF